MDASFLPADTARIGSLTRLLDVAVRLGVEHDIDAILQVATQGVCAAVGCERASLFLADNEKRELLTRVVTELEIAEIRHPFDRGVIGWVATTRELLCVPDPHQDARWDPSVDRKTGFRTRNILAAPVVSLSDGRLLGVLQLLNKSDEFDDLDEQLVQAFAAHVALALDRRRMEDEARQHSLLRQTLETGHKIQTSLLPAELPAIPEYEVAAWWQPAEFVSGDYYDWLPLGSGEWSFVLGDVSGHGLPAALLMASVRAMARVLSQTETDPQAFVEILRESIEPDLSNGRFITLLCVTLDPQSHAVRLWNAGHGPAFIVRAETGACERIAATTTPLGFPCVPATSTTVTTAMAAGDVIVMGTDGVVEVSDADGLMFGVPRLMDIVRRHRYESATAIVTAVNDAVQAFRGPLPAPDDTTLIILRRHSAPL
jgi:serine phosphatase RsbU (regulator of sigma subunit)